MASAPFHKPTLGASIAIIVAVILLYHFCVKDKRTQ